MQIWFLSNGSYSLKNCHNPFGKAIQPPSPLQQNSGWTPKILAWGLPDPNWNIIIAGAKQFWANNGGLIIFYESEAGKQSEEISFAKWEDFFCKARRFLLQSKEITFPKRAISFAKPGYYFSKAEHYLYLIWLLKGKKRSRGSTLVVRPLPDLHSMISKWHLT